MGEDDLPVGAAVREHWPDHARGCTRDVDVGIGRRIHRGPGPRAIKLPPDLGAILELVGPPVALVRGLGG